MSKAHPNNGGTFTKGKPKARKRKHGDDPRLDPSKPPVFIPQKTRDFLDELIDRMPEIAPKWTTGRP
jgi:hypothetical protein